MSLNPDRNRDKATAASTTPLLSFIRFQARCQTWAAVGIGLTYLTLPARVIISNPIANYITTAVLRQPAPPTAQTLALLPPAVQRVLEQQTALSGLFLFAVGCVYAIADARDDGDWLHVAVRERLIVLAAGALMLVFAPQRMGPLMVLTWVNDGSFAILATAVMAGWIGGEGGKCCEEGAEKGVAREEKAQLGEKWEKERD